MFLLNLSKTFSFKCTRKQELSNYLRVYVYEREHTEVEHLSNTHIPWPHIRPGRGAQSGSDFNKGIF